MMITIFSLMASGAHALALQRLDAILTALVRYEPDLSRVKGIGFCVSVRHAEYMASMFNERGITSAVLVARRETCRQHINSL